MNKDQLQVKYGIGGNTCIFEWRKKYGKLHYPTKGSIGEILGEELADAKLKLLAYERLIAIAE